MGYRSGLGGVVGDGCELDGGVGMVQMMTVVDVVECDGCCGEQVEVDGVGSSQLHGCLEGIYKERYTAFHAIPQAMKELVPWRMLEISEVWRMSFQTV